jgi:hypothetical protein
MKSGHQEAFFPGDKAAGAWSWPLTSNKYQGQENLDLYIHSPILLYVQCLVMHAHNLNFFYIMM